MGFDALLGALLMPLFSFHVGDALRRLDQSRLIGLDIRSVDLNTHRSGSSDRVIQPSLSPLLVLV